MFATGRTMSVQSHRVEGASIVLVPRGGGEITCPASMVARIEADEAPYPEPERDAPQVAADVTASRADVASLDHPEYDRFIDQASSEHGVDASLVRAVIQVESRYRERARSPKGAMGLMQLMPATARQYAVTDPYDPASNIRAGVRHLKSLLERFPLTLALAAYNAGEAAVERFRGVPPYPETRNYVQRVLELTRR